MEGRFHGAADFDADRLHAPADLHHLPHSPDRRLERLLRPLKKVRFPVHELSMMMSIALRFIPTLIQETDKIISAPEGPGS